jgi:hypothetical protein
MEPFPRVHQQSYLEVLDRSSIGLVLNRITHPNERSTLMDEKETAECREAPGLWSCGNLGMPHCPYARRSVASAVVLAEVEGNCPWKLRYLQSVGD